MSLISEALRKARRQGDAPGRGPALPPTLVLPPRRYRSGLSPVALVLVALAAGLGGAAGVWWALTRQPRTEVVPKSVPAPHTLAAVATAFPEPPAPPAIPSAPPPRPAAPETAEVAHPVQNPTASPDSPPLPTASHSAPEKLAAPGFAATGARGGGEREKRVFLVDADLGYARLHLDYLVFRPGSPFGRINGQDVIVGTTVDGFLVEEITEDYIRLTDSRNEVFLRVR